MRRPLLALVAALALAPGVAHAAGCPKGATCGVLTVPLDHTGATPGTLPLAYSRMPATGDRTGTIVLLSGGPGQPAIPFTVSFSALLKSVRAHNDLVFVDQRGTGRSGATDCPGVSRDEDATACGELLGGRRAFLTTTETAADLEDLRVALGVEQLTPLGVSYGTAVADAYARRFPEHTAAVILDSPVPPDGSDPLDQKAIAAIPRVLAEDCTGDCRRTAGRKVAAALPKAVARLPLRGPLVGRGGDVSSYTVTEGLLLDALRTSDVQPVLRSELPAAIASLARGDAAPLLHAVLLWEDESADINLARLFATDCVEESLPWAPDAPLAGRDQALQDYVATLGPHPFGPFDVRNALSTTIATTCVFWPPTPRPAPLPPAPPSAPTLVISGRDDIRTPLESARRIAAGYPHATLLKVPKVGHSVLRHDQTGCALRGLAAFLAGRPVAACGKVDPFVPAARYRPARVGALRAVGARGPAGRTLSAVYYTLDASWRDRELYDAWYGLTRSVSLPALRRGSIVVSRGGLVLRRAETVRGVRVSGRLQRDGTGRLRVAGSVGGSVVIGRRRVSGVLGGVRVSDRR